MPAKTSKLDTIERLLAKAESTTPEEAEALTAAAEKMMIRYGIDQAMIAAKRASDTAPEEIVKVIMTLKGGYLTGVKTMMSYVVRAMPAVRMFTVGGQSDKIVLVGYKSDVEQAQLLLNSLHLQAFSAMSVWWRNSAERKYLQGQERNRARKSFIISFGLGASERIREATTEATTETPGSAIALRDRSGEVDAFLSGAVRLRKGRRIKQSTIGQHEGRMAGRSANVGTTGISANSRKELS